MTDVGLSALRQSPPSVPARLARLRGTSESSEQPEHRAKCHLIRAARLVVFGDSEFANNNLFPVQGNGNLFLNTVSWLAEGGETSLPYDHAKGWQRSSDADGCPGSVIFLAASGCCYRWGYLGSGAVVFVRRKWQQ